MTRYRYPPQALLADYGRAGLGLAATGVPLLFVPPNPAIIAVLGGLAGLFLVFGLRTGLRQLTCVEMSEQGVSVSGLRFMSLEWQSIRDVRLRYYSIRRDRTQGWMQLRLDGPKGPLSFDSNLNGFDDLVRRAAAAARAAGLKLNATTLDNLGALGIDRTGLGAESEEQPMKDAG